MKYRVLIERDEEGVYVATVPTLPGCVSDGATREAALRHVREAIALYIESLEEHGDPVPPPIIEQLSRTLGQCAFTTTVKLCLGFRSSP